MSSRGCHRPAATFGDPPDCHVAPIGAAHGGAAELAQSLAVEAVVPARSASTWIAPVNVSEEDERGN